MLLVRRRKESWMLKVTHASRLIRYFARLSSQF
jgi:hypothetical protein